MPKKRTSKRPKPRADAAIKPAGKKAPSVWEEFFEFVRGIDIPKDWMKDRPMNRIPTVDRTCFSEED
jgi:hypothetical protein